MEQAKKPRGKLMRLCPINLWQRQEYRVKKTVFSISGAGKTGQLHVKE